MLFDIPDQPIPQPGLTLRRESWRNRSAMTATLTFINGLGCGSPPSFNSLSRWLVVAYRATTNDDPQPASVIPYVFVVHLHVRVTICCICFEPVRNITNELLGLPGAKELLLRCWAFQLQPALTLRLIRLRRLQPLLSKLHDAARISNVETLRVHHLSFTSFRCEASCASPMSLFCRGSPCITTRYAPNRVRR